MLFLPMCGQLAVQALWRLPHFLVKVGWVEGRLTALGVGKVQPLPSDLLQPSTAPQVVCDWLSNRECFFSPILLTRDLLCFFTTCLEARHPIPQGSHRALIVCMLAVRLAGALLQPRAERQLCCATWANSCSGPLLAEHPRPVGTSTADISTC